ncbi:hydrolase 1, exosortase A system-associated [Nitrosospira sp. Is2]|uniref:hydrolase 1, exosortase A system-associated n=1 Tax=Nitrosospira sp. Is2 TaxID=3080532 RepID=UPI002954EC18|nr:hydrolase 1, exosortase A system-associated [Nitrosospira sp. Is2]WON72633.1 hydrolase 1, exosortase A system-associated [Nitrosospira sp. Is2]
MSLLPDTNVEERPLVVECNDAWLYGMISLPEQIGSRGVLILVGGPQYRVGSHRQFTLLARNLAADGIPVFRFDCRGMGDSEGDPRDFERLEDDLHCAIDRFLQELPALDELVIWGLCDAASAALFYAHRDPRVTGLVLLNPWVRTEQGEAKAYLKHYYLTRFFNKEFWGKVLSGRFDYSTATRSFTRTIARAAAGRRANEHGQKEPARTGESCDPANLPDRMLDGLRRFNGKILLIISGNDLTAQEFSDLVSASPGWQRLLAAPRVSRHNLPEADHTFSRRLWRDQVADITRNWIRSW